MALEIVRAVNMRTATRFWRDDL